MIGFGNICTLREAYSCTCNRVFPECSGNQSRQRGEYNEELNRKTSQKLIWNGDSCSQTKQSHCAYCHEQNHYHWPRAPFKLIMTIDNYRIANDCFNWNNVDKQSFEHRSQPVKRTENSTWVYNSEQTPLKQWRLRPHSLDTGDNSEKRWLNHTPELKPCPIAETHCSPERSATARTRSPTTLNSPMLYPRIL
jgi:hypothetical protein